ncbi:hypothetical protein F511_40883 [Dorcoceras hygrometricum]|uniref:DNA-directed RNA polymerase V subunit 1 n=1 Tax=Dorcoceras hygrometricum TaxID=472368 RepID=A0A2Z7D332_9LAMI|nr:hypothetical protein F511_40883 [Dorcoceras hygrometricum]
MSLFDLQDVCIAIGSLATLDLPMVVDMIGIYGLKGPYCTLTTTNWFLQALSLIPRGSWGDVARRSYHDPLDAASPPPKASPPPPVHAAAAVAASPEFIPANLDEENPTLTSSISTSQLSANAPPSAAAKFGGFVRLNLAKTSSISPICLVTSSTY